MPPQADRKPRGGAEGISLELSPANGVLVLKAATKAATDEPLRDAHEYLNRTRLYEATRMETFKVPLPNRVESS